MAKTDRPVPFSGAGFFIIERMTEMEEKIIAVAIIIGTNKMLNYHLSGSLREYSSMAATNLLLYETALWGNANGYKTFHLGGGVGAADDGLLHFKKAFYRGELTKFCIGKRIFIKDVYEELVRYRGDSVKEKKFFPLYRA